jgi:hypothetical protein
MAFSIVAWSESQDTAGILTAVQALVDQHITTEGDNVLVPSFAPNLAGVFALGATISQAQVTSPSLRRGLLFDVAPINIGAEPVNRPYMHDLFRNPIPLVPSEGLQVRVAEGAAGAERETVLAWLQSEFEEPASGEIMTVRATSTTTLTADVWSLCNLTLSQQLEAGRYQIVGMKATSAGAVAARLVLPGSEFRPGVIAGDSLGDVSIVNQRYGNHGVFGEFEHTFVPAVEFLSGSADTTEEVYLDIIKVA